MMAERGPTNLPLIIGAILLSFVIGFAVTYALPLADGATTASGSLTPELSDEAAAGKDLYDNQGCWYCHTQDVRPVPNDLGLGTASSPEQANQRGLSVVGLTRIGPDLSCIGDRAEDADALVAHLIDPRASRPDSPMPDYVHLDATELAAIAAYLMALHCEG